MAAEQQQTRVATGGSRFAAACGLLRQYMMEQGGGRGAVTVGLMPSGAQAVVAEERIKKTMELFPQQPGTLRDGSHGSRILERADRAQLTIFYRGCTIVFDDFPADKADELMQLASSFVAPATAHDAVADPVRASLVLHPFLADMPLARKASLQRFLEKRRRRLAAADPYPVTSVAWAPKETSKPGQSGGAPWLAVDYSRLNLN